MRTGGDRRLDLLAAAALAIGKIGLGAWLLARGFSHVSDDDYARNVIAERFAHAPALDPSGTSWLPFPFWVYGAAMAAFGRTLGCARGVALAMGALGAVTVYAALRRAGVACVVAASGVAVAMATPWSAWTGATTVPEGFSAAFAAAALIACAPAPAHAPGTAHASSSGDGDGSVRRVPYAAAALVAAATLSRYEAWPIALVFAAAWAWRARRGSPGERRACAVVVAIALAGPLAWMAWNLHSHGSATHFLARVARYRDALGGAPTSTGELLLLYPRAVARAAPEIALLGGLGVAVVSTTRADRRRWHWPLVGVLAMLAFLAIGELRGGAPTHHPERAVMTAWWILAPLGVGAIAAAAGRFPRAGALLAAGAAVAWQLFGSPLGTAAAPGRSADEDRAPQIARGLELRASGARPLTVTPCAYEHFALVAAYGAPEDVTIASPPTPAGAAAARVTPDCPRVEVR